MPKRNNNKRSKRPTPRKTNKVENVDKKNIDNKENNKENKKGNRKRKSHSKLKLALKIFLILFLLLCVAGAGVIAAMFFGLFGEEFEISKEELTVGASNTIIVDKDGNEIANLSSDEKRKIISLSEMSEYLCLHTSASILMIHATSISHSAVFNIASSGPFVNTGTHSFRAEI